MSAQPKTIFWSLFFSCCLLGGLLFAESGEAEVLRGKIQNPQDPGVSPLNLDPHYTKILYCKGFPIVSSDQVSDFALHEAAYLIDKMIGHREDILEEMARQKVRLAIMAPQEFTTQIPEHATLEPKIYWDKRARGLGASRTRPAVSVGEENLLGYPGDPYSTESILIHEFAHAIHLMGVNFVDPGFQERLDQAFGRAKLKGLWKGKYAGTNPSEYYAEAVQSWFDTNREDDHDHNHVDTREELIAYDPEVAELVKEIFGDHEWRYIAPAERYGQAHLKGFDAENRPTFSWPPELVKAYADLEKGKGLVVVELKKMDAFGKDTVTKTSGPSITLRVENESKLGVSIHWIGFDGLRREYGKADPGRRIEQQTYGGHHWVVVDEQGTDLGWIVAPDKDAKITIP